MGCRRRVSSLLLLLLLGLLVGGCGARRDGVWVSPRAGSNGTVADPGVGGTATCPGQLAAPAANFLFCLCTLGLGSMLVWSGLRARALRRQAASEKSIDPAAPLSAGPYVVVGTVEVENGENPVVIQIEQAGTETKHKNSWSHAWKETRRRVEVHPFVVRRDDGRAIKVEPDARVVLHDSLSRILPASSTLRTRIAELKPGDRIYATGKLVDVGVHGGGGVYREAPRFPRLIPASSGPMILSTEAPGGTAHRLARVHRGCAIAVGIALAFQLVALSVPLWIQHLAGTTTTATVRSVRTYQTYHKPRNGSGYWTTHQEALVAWGDNVSTFRIAEDLYNCAVFGGCSRVVVRHASIPGFTTTQLGSNPTLGLTRSIVLLALFCVALIGWLIAVIGARPWWLRSRVVDRGSGRLSHATSSVKDAVLTPDER